MTGAGVVQSASTIGFETLYAGYRWDNPAPQMYYVRNRFLLPQVGTWNKRDPLGNVDGMGLLAYSTPVVGSDPTGMMPNLQNLVPIEFIIGEIRKIETAHPGKSPAEILSILNARMKSNGNWWYYVYTQKSGFIDLPHFTESAIWSSDPNIQDCCGSHSVYLTYAGSIGVEINQVKFQAYHDWMMRYLAIYRERLFTAAKNENNGWKKWFLQQLVWGA